LLRAQAETLLDQGRPGDLWQLVRIAGSAPYALIAEPARQANPVRDELRALATTEETGDLLAALRTTASLLSMNAAADLREVHVFTDAQRTAWRPTDAAQRSELHAAWKEIAQKARILWHDVGDAALVNAALTDLVPSATPAFPLQAIRVNATVRQFGGSIPQQRTLQWYIDDRLSGAETIELTPGEAITREFTVTATTPAVRIEARLDADALAADNHRYLVVPVLATLPVLLVDGRPSPQPFESASAFVQLALGATRQHRSGEWRDRAEGDRRWRTGEYRPHAVCGGLPVRCPAADRSRCRRAAAICRPGRRARHRAGTGRAGRELQRRPASQRSGFAAIATE
jgi:hypothetical protein